MTNETTRDEIDEIDQGTTPFPVEAEERDEPANEELLESTLLVVRDLILQANPDLIPELVRGETLTELMESVPAAKDAFQRIREQMRAQVPTVPAGGAATAVIDGPAEVLIRQAIISKRREN
jgi:hypothetical protein